MNSRSNNRGHRQHPAPTLDFVHVLLTMKAMRRTRDRCVPARPRLGRLTEFYAWALSG